MSVGRIILKAKHDGAGADRVNPELVCAPPFTRDMHVRADE